MYSREIKYVTCMHRNTPPRCVASPSFPCLYTTVNCSFPPINHTERAEFPVDWCMIMKRIFEVYDVNILGICFVIGYLQWCWRSWAWSCWPVLEWWQSKQMRKLHRGPYMATVSAPVLGPLYLSEARGRISPTATLSLPHNMSCLQENDVHMEASEQDQSSSSFSLPSSP